MERGNRLKKLGIIILNWNGEKDTVACINSIKDNIQKEIFILDNNSSKDSIDYLVSNLSLESDSVIYLEDFLNKKSLNDFKPITLIQSKENLGFAKGNNVVWEKIYQEYEYCLLLNNDTELTEKSIDLLVHFMDSNPNIGVASTDIRLYDSPKKLWNAGGYFTIYGDRKYYSSNYIKNSKHSFIKTEFVTGCVMLIRQSVVEKIGFFSEKFFFGEEDFNYCLRLKKNNINVSTLLDTSILHKVGTSAKKNDKNNNRYILHFVNRIIDMRMFYSPLKWFIWSKLYLISIFIHSFFKSKKFKEAWRRIKLINKYSMENKKVDKKLFQEIMNLS